MVIRRRSVDEEVIAAARIAVHRDELLAAPHLRASFEYGDGERLQRAHRREGEARAGMLDTLWTNDDCVTVFENGYANYGWSGYRNHHLEA